MLNDLLDTLDLIYYMFIYGFENHQVYMAVFKFYFDKNFLADFKFTFGFIWILIGYINYNYKKRAFYKALCNQIS